MGERKKIDAPEIVSMIGILLILCALIFLGYYFYSWLRYGEWDYITVSDGLIYFGVDTYDVIKSINWIGLLKIVEWLFKIPIALAIFVIGIFSIMWGESNSH